MVFNSIFRSFDTHKEFECLLKTEIRSECDCAIIQLDIIVLFHGFNKSSLLLEPSSPASGWYHSGVLILEFLFHECDIICSSNLII